MLLSQFLISKSVNYTFLSTDCIKYDIMMFRQKIQTVGKELCVKVLYIKQSSNDPAAGRTISSSW
jgi:hypothetical protein